MSKTEMMRRGLLAAGWVRCETPSGRECYTKKLIITERPCFTWLGEACSLRHAEVNAFTQSVTYSEAFKLKLIELGNPVRALVAYKADYELRSKHGLV